MLLTASEGRHWRYEVREHSDGYLVEMRDLHTGARDDEFTTVFRTLPVAFAYAAMSAAFEWYAAAELSDDDGEDRLGADFALQVQRTERTFVDLSDRLRDSGITGEAMRVWERACEARPTPRYH